MNKSESGLTLNSNITSNPEAFSNVLSRYHEAVLGNEPVTAIRKLFPTFNLAERVLVAKHNPEAMFPTSELFKDFVVSPSFISEQGSAIQPGQVMVLDRNELTPEELTQLIEPTRRKQYEVELSYDHLLKAVFYFVGGEHKVHITPLQSLVTAGISPDIRFDLHTHPIWSLLLTSPSDREASLWSGPSCRFFIGKHGDLEDDGYDGLEFQEFNRFGEKINGRTQTEEMSEILSEIVRHL